MAALLICEEVGGYIREMGTFFYGISETGCFESHHKGIAAGRIQTIRHRDICAVVNQVPENYKGALKDALTYEGVLRRAMEKAPVIPMSFGTIVKDPVEIQKILKMGYATLKQTLNRIKGKLQINVSASWNEKAVLKRILVEDIQLRTLKEKVVKNPANSSLKIELGRRVKKAIDEKRREIAPSITSALQNLSDDFEENKTKDRNTILNASFLVEKTLEQAFHAKAEELERRYVKEIKLVVIGSLPLYNFTRIEIKNVDFKTVKEAQRTLGLSEALSISEIHQAFNNLVQSHHPDLHPNNPLAAETFARIRKAYDVLMEYCEHSHFSIKKTDVEDTIIIRERHS